MRKIFIILFAVLLQVCTNLYVFGQDDRREQTPKNEFNPYLFWGGSFWAGIGSYTFVDANVIVGSQLTERLNIGIIGKYQYHKDKRSSDGNFENSVYGGSLFSQFAVIKDFRNVFPVRAYSGIIFHAEYEFLNTKYNYLYLNVADPDKGRYWLNNILIGGGYYQHMGEKSKTFILLLWNANETIDNPYSYPQLRIGFTSSF